MTEPMQAGRELDLMVAERVMREVEANAPCGDGLTRTISAIGMTLDECDVNIRGAYPKRIAQGMKIWPAQYIGPAYSTDIAAAWQVVEKMRERGYWVDIEPRDYDDRTRSWSSKGWRVGILPPNDGPGFYCEEEAETAPHAICLAALAAVAASGSSDTGERR